MKSDTRPYLQNKSTGEIVYLPEPAPSCATCVAWKPKPNQDHPPIFGGCARGGTTTLHYGDKAYNHYTTDLQSCSAWGAR